MEPVKIYERNEDISESERDDLWDDKVLVKAYNKSVKEIKQKIVQRLGMSNGFSEQSEPDENEVSKSVVDEQLRKAKNTRKNKWKKGDYCRAIYSHDGLEYEAEIVTILSDEKCIVKFHGYDNLETVKLQSLKLSLGKKWRSKQKLEADEQENASPDVNAECTNFPQPIIPGLQAIPPPPAFSLSSEFNCDNESDALSAMLMSWYMSGYHTGYYQGLLQGKKLSKK